MPFAGLLAPDGARVGKGEVFAPFRPERWDGMSEPLMRALVGLADKPQDCWRSVTQLIGAPLRARLQIEKDFYVRPEALWFRFYGQLAHLALEQGNDPGAIREHRMHLLWLPDMLLIGGTLDHWKRGLLTDAKTISAYGAKLVLRDGIEAEHPEYIAQVNLYALMLRREHIFTNKAQIQFVVRDWTAKDSVPRSFCVGVPLWDEKPGWEWLGQRVAAHRVEDPGPCDDRDDFGKVKGVPRRCGEYCDVASECPHYKAMLAGGEEGA